MLEPCFFLPLSSFFTFEHFYVSRTFHQQERMGKDEREERRRVERFERQQDCASMEVVDDFFISSELFN